MFSEDFETDFGLKQNGGVMKEEHNRDLTNLDLRGRVWEIVIYADFFYKMY